MRLSLDYHRPLHVAVYDPAHDQYWDYAAAKWVPASGAPLSPPVGAMLPMESDATAPDNRHVDITVPDGGELIARFFEKQGTVWKYVSHTLVVHFPGPVSPGAVAYRC